jgi:hypothetical protein
METVELIDGAAGSIYKAPFFVGVGDPETNGMARP